MKSRWFRIIGAILLTCGTLCGPAYAQRNKQLAPAQPDPPKPVGQYILLVILIAIPIGVVCRSSRRM